MCLTGLVCVCLCRSLSTLSVLSGQIVRGLSAGGRIWEYMRLKPSVPLAQGRTIPTHCLHGNIKFDNVTFTYPSRVDQVRCGLSKKTLTHAHTWFNVDS